MICNAFRVSPADHPWPLMADPRTIGKWVGGGPRVAPDGAVGLASLEIGGPERRGAGTATTTACLSAGVVPGAAVGGGACKWLEQKARPGVCPDEYPHLFQAEPLKGPDDL